MQLRGTSSCGIYELFELSNYYAAERNVKDERENPTPENLVKYAKSAHVGMIMFSDNIDKSRAGTNLAQYIRDNKIGQIVDGPTSKSNHGGRIRAWLWSIYATEEPTPDGGNAVATG